METELLSHLDACARAYGAATGLRLSTIGRKVTNDGQFFTRLRDPKATFTVRKYDAVIQWFDVNWPDGVRWPEGVQRPSAISGAHQ
jgi:hypothetical protein